MDRYPGPVTRQRFERGGIEDHVASFRKPFERVVRMILSGLAA